MERKYRVYAHGCYIHGLASIDEDVPDLIAAAKLYRSRLDRYPYITRIAILDEKGYLKQPNIGPLTVKRAIVTETRPSGFRVWEIGERYKDGQWRFGFSWYNDFETARNIIKDIARLRSNRVHAMGYKMPFWAVLKSDNQNTLF